MLITKNWYFKLIESELEFLKETRTFLAVYTLQHSQLKESSSICVVVNEVKKDSRFSYETLAFKNK